MTIGRKVFTLAILLGALLDATVAYGGVTVTVRDGSGTVAGARVCLGNTTSRLAYGSALTNPAGVATFTQVPAGVFVVIAEHLNRGVMATVPAGVAAPALTLVLSTSAGPQCSDVEIQTLPTGIPGLLGTGDHPIIPAPIVLREIPKLDNPAVFSPIVLNLNKPQHCFGALGAECGGAQFFVPVAALCGLGRCSINGGSWRHDECCVAHPMGMACRYGPLDQLTGNDGNCAAEWNRATSRLNYVWGRAVDFNKTNSTGAVVFAEYCAQTGSRVHKDDVEFCCAGHAHTEQVASQFADANIRSCD